MSPLFRKNRPAEILLVEDNEGDVLLTREGLKRVNFEVNLHHAGDGEECLAFLRKEGRYADAPTPDLILLDLNMPIMGGQEVMEILVADEALRSIPVVVLTTSSSDKTIQELYRLGCNTYVVKPLCFEEFQHAIQAIGEYWFGVATVPRENC